MIRSTSARTTVAPSTARLSASVPPLVNTISAGFAFSRAEWFRASPKNGRFQPLMV